MTLTRNTLLVASAFAAAAMLTITPSQSRSPDRQFELADGKRLAAVESATDTPANPPRTMSGRAMGAFLAGRQARKDGDTTAAAHYFSLALAEDPSNSWLTRRSFLLDVADGRIERALPMAEKVIDTANRAPVASLVTAADHMKHERYGKTEAFVAKAGTRGAMQLLGPLMRAWAAFGADNMQGALGKLRPLEKSQTFAPFLAYHKGLLLGASGDAAGALEAFDSLPENVSLNLRSRLVYAALLERRDGAEASSAYLKGLAARYGEDPVLRAYLHHGRPISDAFPVRNAQDGMAEAFYGAASALSRDSVEDVSLIYLQLALYMRPDLDVAHALLGDLLEEKGHWNESIAAYNRIEDVSPYKWSARIRVAWALDSLDRTDEAERLLREMADERPDNVTTLATLADVMRGHSRFGDAAKVYGEAIERIGTPEPRHWSIFYAHGIALERSKQWDAAEQSLLKALELSPDQPLVMNYLGYSWADQGIQLERAIAMVKKAVDLRPSDGYVIDSLGWAHYRNGDYEQALKHLERATELRPEDPIINEHLGDVYWKVGRRLESCFQWRHALSLDPDEHQIPIIRAKMSDGLDEDTQGFSGCRF